MTMTNDRVTNQSVADRLGIDQSYVSLIRRGIRVPSRDVVVALVEAYEVDQGQLMAAYTSRDPVAFADCFNQIVGFSDVEGEQVVSESR
jgi:transcriptional regulator with XRE-family HTH domain